MGGSPLKVGFVSACWDGQCQRSPTFETNSQHLFLIERKVRKASFGAASNGLSILNSDVRAKSVSEKTRNPAGEWHWWLQIACERLLPALPKTRAQRDNICLTGTYLVPLEPRTLLT